MEMRSSEELAGLCDAGAHHGCESFRNRVQADHIGAFTAHEFGFHDLPPRNFGVIADTGGFVHLVPPPSPDTGPSGKAPVDGRFRDRRGLPRHVGLPVDGVRLGLRRNSLLREFAGVTPQHREMTV